MDFNFAERFIYHQFRMAIRTTLSLSGVSLERLSELLRLAAYDELKEVGMNNVMIASHLKTVPSNITKMTRIERPSVPENKMPLYLLALEALYEAEGYQLAEPDIWSQALTASTNDGRADEGGHYTLAEERDFSRALNYLELQGLIEVTDTHIYRLSPAGIKLMEREIAKPFQRNNERLATLLLLCGYLAKQKRPQTKGDLEAAQQAGHLKLRGSSLSDTLKWCEKLPFVQIDMTGDEALYSVASEAWLTPKTKADGKQFTLTTMVDDLKYFIHWITQEPDAKITALKSIRFSVLPDEVYELFSAHRRLTYQLLTEADERAKGHPDALNYGLNWFAWQRDEVEGFRVKKKK